MSITYTELPKYFWNAHSTKKYMEEVQKYKFEFLNHIVRILREGYGWALIVVFCAGGIYLAMSVSESFNHWSVSLVVLIMLLCVLLLIILVRARWKDDNFENFLLEFGAYKDCHPLSLMVPYTQKMLSTYPNAEFRVMWLRTAQAEDAFPSHMILQCRRDTMNSCSVLETVAVFEHGHVVHPDDVA